MRLVITGILAALMMIHQSALAAPNNYEIDLKELRATTPRQPAKKTDQHKRKRHTTAERGIGTTETGQESIYVVRAGDHLFQILMKKYGLSDPEAERLIPSVMQLNGISSPKGLKVGQRLRIPLPATERSRNAASREPAPELHTAPPVADATAAPQSSPAPVTAEAASPQPTAPPLEAGIISLIYESPCKLALSLVKKLGLPASVRPDITGVEAVGAAHAGRNVTVICGLSEAERYTYERLLASGGRQLLFFDEDEDADYVLEELADSLGLEYRKNETDATAPLSYIFPPLAAGTQELHLTIFPSGLPQQ